MSYYKIAYESDAIDGLKAIQAGFSGQGSAAADSGNSQVAVSPPPQSTADNSDAFQDLVPAPPVADIASTDFQDGNSPQPPPQGETDSAGLDIASDADVPPPPKDK